MVWKVELLLLLGNGGFGLDRLGYQRELVERGLLACGVALRGYRMDYSVGYKRDLAGMLRETFGYLVVYAALRQGLGVPVLSGCAGNLSLLVGDLEGMSGGILRIPVWLRSQLDYMAVWQGDFGMRINIRVLERAYRELKGWYVGLG